MITLSYENYSLLLHMAASATLNELNEMVNSSLISPDEYLGKLGQLLASNRITEAEYLHSIAITKEATGSLSVNIWHINQRHLMRWRANIAAEQ